MDFGESLPALPMELAGEAEDAALCLAAALSREEVLRRRRRRLLQLFSLYKAQYWALADELPSKLGDYYWRYGASPLAEEPPAEYGVAGEKKKGGAGALVGSRLECAISLCGAMAMPLATHCFKHILSDPRQRLYKPCKFVSRESSMQNGKIACGRPVLRGVTPSHCSAHVLKAQKNIEIALRTAGVNWPSTNKTVPKLSVLISESIHQIQMKRKQSLDGPENALSYQ